MLENGASTDPRMAGGGEGGEGGGSCGDGGGDLGERIPVVEGGGGEGGGGEGGGGGGNDGEPGGGGDGGGEGGGGGGEGGGEGESTQSDRVTSHELAGPSIKSKHKYFDWNFKAPRKTPS